MLCLWASSQSPGTVLRLMNLISRVPSVPSSLPDVSGIAEPLSVGDDLTQPLCAFPFSAVNSLEPSPGILFIQLQKSAWKFSGRWRPLGLLNATINQILSLGHIFCIINFGADRHFLGGPILFCLSVSCQGLLSDGWPSSDNTVVDDAYDQGAGTLNTRGSGNILCICGGNLAGALL